MLGKETEFDRHTTTIQENERLPALFKEQNQKDQPIVETIYAVREVLIGLFEEQKEQHRMKTTTTNHGASRLNNTTVMNVTDDDFIKMIEEIS
ncbi:unnamed protein product [Rotaria socialis]|uniref:Uncharacterized protein n=1 Tax=Rotaria socialis TaxID=392032 RepID=A0A817V2X1_9BILA|nr:unnamed protein product [Rotaria socialis]CAF3337678.1 unnamed protein product [Rotaria socialis]CAF3518342.1 unnamed protein product [Rotaria socialis]CAF3682245.1 unnamed protein product [Rotaria socialis]CAF4465857.1 unnamed protein product [Rotaria socialis]